MTSSSTEKLKETITEMRNNISAILTSLNNDVGATINKMNSLIDKSTKSLELSVKAFLLLLLLWKNRSRNHLLNSIIAWELL